jgi:hypothetical protein
MSQHALVTPALLAWLCTSLTAQAVTAEASAVVRPTQPQPIDFASIPRNVDKLPHLVSEQPLYGLFLFGKDGQHRVWAVLDKQAAHHQRYDVLYLDLDANGDLTATGERFAAAPVADTDPAALRNAATFVIGQFREPGSEESRPVHNDFTLTWKPASIRF